MDRVGPEPLPSMNRPLGQRELNIGGMETVLDNAEARCPDSAPVPRPSWSDFFQSPVAYEPQLLAQLDVVLQHQPKDQSAASLSSPEVLAALNVAELNSLLTSLKGMEGMQAEAILTALNAILTKVPDTLLVALVHHGTVEALVLGIHKHLGLTHSLSPLVIEALNMLCVGCEAVLGHTDPLAVKQELVELVLGAIIWMAITPERLHTYSGLTSALRTVNMCWSLCRHNTPASILNFNTFVSVELGPRCLHLAAAAASEDSQQGTVSAPADTQPPQPGDPGPQGVPIGDLRTSLVTLSSGFAISLLGLGPALDTSSAGLHRLRRMTLRRSLMADARSILSFLVDTLHSPSQYRADTGSGTDQQQQQQQHVSSEGDTPLPLPLGGGGQLGTGSSSSSSPVLGQQPDATTSSTPPSSAAPLSLPPSESVQIAVEGAVRNLLCFLSVPLLCSDGTQETEVQALTSFALQYCYLMYQEDFTPIFKRLSNRASPYRGLYLPYFCATSDLMNDCISVIGQQLSAWGVQMDKDTNPSSDPNLWVPGTGVDAASAHEFIALQVVNCVKWSQRFFKLIMVSKRVDACVSGQTIAGAPTAQAESGGASLPASSHMDSGSSQVCSFCGKAAEARILKGCPCGQARYCDKTCQTAHFPQHRQKCKEARKQGRTG